MKNNQWNHIGMFMHLTQVKAVLFAIISATSYYRFLAPPLSKSHVVFTVSKSTMCTQITGIYLESIWCVWQHVHNEEARRVNIPGIHSIVLLPELLVSLMHVYTLH